MKIRTALLAAAMLVGAALSPRAQNASFQLPGIGNLQVWTTTTRPGNASNGTIGYNSTTHDVELRANDAWVDMGGGAGIAACTVFGTTSGTCTQGGTVRTLSTTQFYADPTGSDSNTCKSTGAGACLHIENALIAASKTDFNNTNVAATAASGTWDESLNMAGAATGVMQNAANGGRLLIGPTSGTVIIAPSAVCASLPSGSFGDGLTLDDQARALIDGPITLSTTCGGRSALFIGNGASVGLNDHNTTFGAAPVDQIHVEASYGQPAFVSSSGYSIGSAAPAWKANTAYVSSAAQIAVGTSALVSNDSGKNYSLKTASCTSDVSGGPTGTGAGITDGTCTWDYTARTALDHINLDASRFELEANRSVSCVANLNYTRFATVSGNGKLSLRPLVSTTTQVQAQGDTSVTVAALGDAFSVGQIVIDSTSGGIPPFTVITSVTGTGPFTLGLNHAINSSAVGIADSIRANPFTNCLGAPACVGNPPYVAGQMVDNGSKIYTQTVVAGCTSAASVGPTGTGTLDGSGNPGTITDNTCRWKHVVADTGQFIVTGYPFLLQTSAVIDGNGSPNLPNGFVVPGDVSSWPLFRSNGVYVPGWDYQGNANPVTILPGSPNTRSAIDPGGVSPGTNCSAPDRWHTISKLYENTQTDFAGITANGQGDVCVVVSHNNTTPTNELLANSATGGIVLGSPTGGAKGTGTINTTGLYINGTALSSSSGIAPVETIHAGNTTASGSGTATGSISQVAGSTFLRLTLIGAGGPGGAGLACGSGASCSGGSGGGAGFRWNWEMLWTDTGGTACTYSIPAPAAVGGDGSNTTVTCNGLQFRVGAGGHGATGASAAASTSGGTGGQTSASGSTAGTLGVAGVTGATGHGLYASAGGGSSNVGVGASGGTSMEGASGGGGGAGCSSGSVGSTGNGGPVGWANSSSGSSTSGWNQSGQGGHGGAANTGSNQSTDGTGGSNYGAAGGGGGDTCNAGSGTVATGGAGAPGAVIDKQW